MTNVFVHYRKLGDLSGETTQIEMLFSRAPVVGEIVYIDSKDSAGYEVVRVDHHPHRNPKPSKQLEGYPEDIEVWLLRKGDLPIPI
jgi:hypothetical protein